MATSNRGGNRGGSSSGNRGGNQRRRGRNNNPEGRNQYSGLTGTARANPLATAAVVGAAAAAAGAFLWSRRNLISEQIGELSDSISDWRDGMGAGEDTGGGRSQAEIAEEALTLKELGETA